MEFVTLSVSETCEFAMERAVGLQNVSLGGGEWLSSTAVLVHSATASGLRKWCG